MMKQWKTKMLSLFCACAISCSILTIPSLATELVVLPMVDIVGTERVAFNDVAESAWYVDDVSYVADRGLMNGTSDTNFSPNLTTSRAMIVTILWRLEGSPAPKGSVQFSDVSASQYYAKAVQWAAENGVVNGLGNGKFAPNQAISREQLAAILYRYAKWQGCDMKEGVSLTSFADYQKISSYAREALSWANAEGFINGMGNQQLAPAGSANRSQVAAILHRFCVAMEK